MSRALPLTVSGVALTVAVLWANDAGPQAVATPQADGDMLVQLAVPAGQFQRVEASTDAQTWQALATVSSNGTAQYRDGGAVYNDRRFYRFVPVSGTSVFTGDHLQTSAGDVVIHPVNHASFVLQWNGKTIYCDATGAATLYSGMPQADVMLVTHSHGDHYSATTINAVRKTTGTVILAPQAVYNSMSATLQGMTTVMTNGASVDTNGFNVNAIPAYNANHPVGSGNGYILTIGGKKIYFSGDTGNIAEMRALTGIDVAFVCMNIPFTMNVTDGVAAVRAFKPKVIYPYHYRNQDGTYANLDLFESGVGTDLGIEVRQRAWY